MKYPFETNNYGHNFVSEKDKEKFLTLKRYVNNYDNKGTEGLVKAIANYTYYFHVSGPVSMKKEEIENLKSIQYLSLLKYFNLENQLLILTQEFDLEDSKVIEFLYKTAKKEKKEKILYNSRIFLDIVYKQYSINNFDKIIEIENIINKKIEDIKTTSIIFKRGNETSYYMNLNHNYAITDEIILNYSEEKRIFLENRGLEPPSIQVATQLLEDITTKYQKREFMTVGDSEKLQSLNQTLNEYEKRILYFDLKDTLREKQIKIKSRKI